MNKYQLIHNNEYLNFEVYIHLIKRLISSTVSNIFLHVPFSLSSYESCGRFNKPYRKNERRV